jgi:hypothetical protein
MHRVIAMLLLAAEAVRSQTCTPEGQQVISTVAGDGSMGTADGAGAAARFKIPQGLGATQGATDI